MSAMFALVIAFIAGATFGALVAAMMVACKRAEEIAAEVHEQLLADQYQTRDEYLDSLTEEERSRLNL